MPALLTSTVGGPYDARAASTVAVQSSSLVTSSRWNCAESPSSLASSSPDSSAMSAITTRAPSVTKPRQIAAPCPWAPPVTMATLPSSRPMSCSCQLDSQIARSAQRLRVDVHHGVGGEADRRVAVGEVRTDLLVELRELPHVATRIEPLL